MSARDALRWGLADMLGATEQELSSRLSLLILRATKDGKRPNADGGMRGLLAYHHGLALQETGKFSDARVAFSEALKLIPDKTEAADAAVRWALCKKGEAGPIQENIKKLLLNPIAANKDKAKKLSEDVDKMLTEAAGFLDTNRTDPGRHRDGGHDVSDAFALTGPPLRREVSRRDPEEGGPTAPAEVVTKRRRA